MERWNLNVNKGHKRIASMNQPDFLSHKLISHSKNTPSHANHPHDDLISSKRHDKWKAEYSEVSPLRK